MTQQSHTVEVDSKYLRGLERSSKWLSYLEAAGVNNWEGSEYAHELQDEYNEAKE